MLRELRLYSVLCYLGSCQLKMQERLHLCDIPRLWSWGYNLVLGHEVQLINTRKRSSTDATKQKPCLSDSGIVCTHFIVGNCTWLDSNCSFNTVSVWISFHKCFCWFQLHVRALNSLWRPTFWLVGPVLGWAHACWSCLRAEMKPGLRYPTDRPVNYRFWLSRVIWRLSALSKILWFGLEELR